MIITKPIAINIKLLLYHHNTWQRMGHQMVMWLVPGGPGSKGHKFDYFLLIRQVGPVQPEAQLHV